MIERDQQVERPDNQGAPLLQTQNLSKRFPGVLAVDDVNLAIYPGEIVALLGQNGAGKSTLIQIFAGAHPHGSYEGDVWFSGTPLRSTNVADAESAGVVLIPQEINIVPDMTVAANISLNQEPRRFGLLDMPAMTAKARQVLADFDLDIDPEARMGSLDLASQQLIVIARALSRQARLLILDEPTAALTEREAQRLFERLRSLRDRGVSCIFVSHRLNEVFSIADRILVMRDGRLRGDHEARFTTRRAIVTEMIGGDVLELSDRAVHGASKLLEITDFTVYDDEDHGRKRVDNISLTVHDGEIVGLFGLIGAGCTTAATAVYGAWPGNVTGSVRVAGVPVAIRKPEDAIAAGIGFIAQDRRQSLVHNHSIADNIVMASLPAVSPHGLLDFDRKTIVANRYVDRLQIRTTTIEARVATLSGGNQQKVQVARWLAADVRILLLADPTRGVDVGARAEINGIWQQLAASGCGLLLVSSDAEELIEICHRILVMRDGQIVSEFAGDFVSESDLIDAAAGG